MAGIWSGFLTFGLVTLPVRLHTGARGERIAFHLLHKDDHVRLKQQMICPQENRPVERDEIARGYEYAKGEYLIIPDEELKAAAPPTERRLEIVEFCPVEQIDAIWYETSYYLMPEPAGRKAYALLETALREAGQVAVARLTMHNREHLALIRASHLAGVSDTAGQGLGQGLVLHTLYYADELRVVEGFGEAERREPPTEGELALARQLISALTKPFDPGVFHDRYRENLEQIIEAHLAGRPAPEHAAAPKLAPVVDLMQSLKESLAQASVSTPTRVAAKRGGHGGRQAVAEATPEDASSAPPKRAAKKRAGADTGASQAGGKEAPKKPPQRAKRRVA